MTSHRPDYFLVGTLAILIVFGILILGSVSPAFSLENTGKTSYFLIHQVMGLLIGLALALTVFFLPISLFKKYAHIALLINLVLMVAVFLPKIGYSFGGASRWINLGFVSFQPSEMLKLTFILYLAAWLSERLKNRKPSFKKNKRPGSNVAILKNTLTPFLITIGLISVLLTFQSDASTLGVIFIIGMGMYFIANTPLWHTLLLVFMGGVGLISLIKIAPYRLSRLFIFLNPEADPMGKGYQIKQALISVGSGSIFGVGLGMSKQKFGFLPQSMGDSIFAVFAEETGLMGSLVIIFLFMFFAFRGWKIIKNSDDQFFKLAASGIILWITIQAFVNIGAMIGILPLTGIPLPFISYGSSALISELIGIGILLNISKYAVNK